MYGAEVTVFSETNTKEIQFEQKVQLLNVKPVGCITQPVSFIEVQLVRHHG